MITLHVCPKQCVPLHAFYAFMRIGEITASMQTSDVLQLGQVTKLLSASGFIASLKLTFHTIITSPQFP